MSPNWCGGWIWPCARPRWEAIFVDDNSPDGTAAAVKEIAAGDPRVRCLKRVGRRGLAGACIEGILSSAAPFVAVIDADLQHDEKVLPAMLARLQGGEADLVAATRYVAGGSAASFSEGRGTISRLATRLTHRLVGTPLSDPMSGFFMMRRATALMRSRRACRPPASRSCWISPPPRARACASPSSPTALANASTAKASSMPRSGWNFLGLLLAKMTGDLLDPRFIFFAIVGSIGLVVHLAVLFAGLLLLEPFRAAQIIATFVAMTSNFLLNNELTYRDRRLKGWAMLRGFVLFCLVCSVGVLANVDLASWLYVERPIWWVAGAVGAVMSVLWNYAMSTLFVWRAR